MKKALLISALALTAMAPAQAKQVTLETGKYPVPVERRVPWTIISGTDCSNPSMEGTDTGGIDKLIDRNPITYWHTNYNECDANDPTHNHWFFIDRGIGASNVPFDMLSIQQRVTDQGWNGAVTEADIYVTDDYIGLIGGTDNKEQDDLAISHFIRKNPTPTTTIHLDENTPEAQLFDFDSEEPQTGRFLLFIVKHAVNPDMDPTQYPEDKYACLAEFNLFSPGYVEAPAANSIGEENPVNAVAASTHTASLTFSDSFTENIRFSPFLQSDKNPYVKEAGLNWLDYDKTYFDITPLMTISVADNHAIEINATGVGSNMYKALFVDFDQKGSFDEADLVHATTEAGSVDGLFEANLDVDVDDYKKVYRARYIVDSEAITSPTPREGIGAAGGIVVDFMVTIEEPVTFTINYYLDGVKVKTVDNVNGFANEPFTRVTPDFFDADVVAVAPDPDNFEAGETPSIDINLRLLTLPFAYTTGEVTSNEDFENLKWQAVQIAFDSKGQKLTWTYNATDKTVTFPAQAASIGRTEIYHETQLWAFVGDIFNGFKIYNKAAGREEWLYKDNAATPNGQVKMGTAENNLWMPYVVRASDNENAQPAANRPSSTYCLIRNTVDGTGKKFINGQTTLQFWNNWSDQNSTCWFVQVADPVIEYARALIELPSNVIGTLSGGDVDALISATEETVVNNNSFDAAEKLLAEIQKYISGSSSTPMDASKWYRMENYLNSGTFMCSGKDDNSNCFGGEVSHKTNYNTVFKFVPVEGKDRYYLLSQGYYLGTCRKSADVQQIKPENVTTNNRGEYSLIEQMPGLFAIKDETGAEYAHLHQNAANKIVGWLPSAENSQWYITLAEDFNMNLPETKVPGMGNVGFGYFPFPVSSADSGTKLYTIEPTTAKETGADVVTYKEVTSVPAETAFMVANEELTTVTLQIDATTSAARLAPALYYDAEAPAKFADGTFRQKNAEAGDFVIDNTGDVLSFKKVAEETPVAGNYIYLPAANVASTADALPFTDPKDTTTGISEVSVEQSAAVKAIYDLQGRKLAAPVKGINIINGKKVLLK